ncbi:MAG: sulfite exporter TauE/SafE family protein [Oligoflexia bacterium]|nr:sulfite exporter TauE/SafE family protein [Oligoflexia bacterium]MBF0366511.1 sulfite exporter TauE/SafE family protein [Oligoflexia bacterium]
MSTLSIFFVLLILGVSAGVVSSFVGIGGGVIILSILYWILPSVDPKVLLVSSLFIVLINASFSVFNFTVFAKKRPNLPFVIKCAFSMMIGTTLGSLLMHELPSVLIKKFFAITLIVVLAHMIWKRWSLRNKSNASTRYQVKGDLTNASSMAVAAVGFTAGVLAGLTGLGGGILLIPFFLTLFRIPIKAIPLYSNSVMCIGVIPGVISGMLSSHVDLTVVASISSGILIGGPIGVKLNQRLPAYVVEIILILILMATSIKILFF